ncbi:MAG: HAMP domain-containing histidine kinase, partial [Candidatus Hydrogenedentes bacterium]|nr:HAMP domain-containing histidine kinase [Candidatus Hydrogenedentota bacterium]
MTIRRRLFWRYAAIVGVCMVVLLGLAHHEFVVEPRVRAEMGIPKPSGSTWGEYAEIVLHALIPVVLGLGWWHLQRTLQPIHAFTSMVERVHADNLGHTLPRSGNRDEIDRLTGVFNDMAQRLNKSLRHAREFAMHASHELKTPLAVMRAEFEAIRDEPLSPTPCHGCAETHLVEIQRLAQMVDSLTLLAKADAGMIEIAREPVVLSDLICECYDNIEALGGPQNIRPTLGPCELAMVLGDRNRLRQLLLNLADNAVKYNTPGGSVTL